MPQSLTFQLLQPQLLQPPLRATLPSRVSSRLRVSLRQFQCTPRLPASSTTSALLRLSLRPSLRAFHALHANLPAAPSLPSWRNPTHRQRLLSLLFRETLLALLISRFCCSAQTLVATRLTILPNRESLSDTSAALVAPSRRIPGLFDIKAALKAGL